MISDRRAEDLLIHEWPTWLEEEACVRAYDDAWSLMQAERVLSESFMAEYERDRQQRT